MPQAIMNFVMANSFDFNFDLTCTLADKCGICQARAVRSLTNGCAAGSVLMPVRGAEAGFISALVPTRSDPKQTNRQQDAVR